MLKNPMRSFMTLLLLLSLPALQQCSKKARLCCEPEPFEQGPNGTWRLIESFGVLSNIMIIFPTDSFYLLRMHSDWTYARVDNGRLIDTGKFTITDTTLSPQKDTLAFIFGTGQPLVYRFVGKDTLYMNMGIMDEAINVYLRTN
jgi:hypothetical protein